eukprot:tig00020944_g16360.t1
MPGVIHIKSGAEFERYTRQNATKLAVVDWTAKWCGPCQRIAPLFEQLAAKYPDVDFLKVDVDECSDLAQSNGVRSMPTFHFWKGGSKAQEFSGADPGRLESTILALRPPPQQTFAGSGQTLGGGTGRSRLLDLAPPPGAAAKPAKPLTPAERRALEAASAADEEAELQEALRMSIQEARKTAAAPPPAPTVHAPPPTALGSAPAPAPAAPAEAAPSASAAAPPGDSAAPPAPDAAAPAPMEVDSAGATAKLPVNPTLLATLLEMGFPEVRAAKGLLATGNKGVEQASEWIFAHMEDPDIDEPWTFEGTDGGKVPNTAPKDDRPIEVRKKEMEDRLAAIRKKKAEQEAEEALERERARREAGRKAAEEAKALKDAEIFREAERRKKEKQDDAAYRLKLREELKRDKEERAKKEAERRGLVPSPPAAAAAPAPAAAAAAPKPAAAAKDYSEAAIQIRLLDGSVIKQTFQPGDKLREVAKFVATKQPGPFNLVNRSAFPPKTYSPADLDATTLQAAGLVPSGTLVVSK